MILVFGQVLIDKHLSSWFRKYSASSSHSKSSIHIIKLSFRLLFVTCNARTETKDDDHRIKPIEVQRNYSNIWTKFPHYNETNTLMISNFYNLEEEFQRNDLVLPQYHPKLGHTDFLDDRHLGYLLDYLNFMESLEFSVGTDVRTQMENFSYENYMRKMTKQMKYDSYKNPSDQALF